MTKLFAWCGVTALVVLGARTLAYALAPVPTVQSLELEQSVGGPRLVVVAVVALGLAFVLATVVVALAALAVRERLLLETRCVAEPPRLQLVRLAGRCSVLFVVTSTAFTLLESTLHWRAGLGWHGIHCLSGPVHRDAIPLLAALSLLAVAIVAAAEHLLAWARRTFARLAASPRVCVSRPRLFVPLLVERPSFWTAAPPPARGPPRRPVATAV